MKRILFYTLISAQVIVILFLMYTFNQINTDGQEIKLQTIKPEYAIHHFQDYLQIDYEINKIDKDVWEYEESMDYNDRIYALLESDDHGIYHVKKASTKRLATTLENEIVLVGTYEYENEQDHIYYVDFGLKTSDNLEQFNPIQKKSLIVTLLIGKWGQHKIINIEKAD